MPVCKDPHSQSCGFSSSHTWMWELGHREDSSEELIWKITVLEETPESPLDCKEIKPVHPKGNQHWIFIGRTDAEAEAPVLWPLDVKSQLIRKDPDAGRDWRRWKSGQQTVRRLDVIINSMDMSLSKLWEIEEDRQAWRDAVHGVTKSQIQLSNWTSTARGRSKGTDSRGT